MRTHILSLLALAACTQSRTAPSASSTATGAPAGATRIQVDVTQCLPVGYGSSCACDIRMPNSTAPDHATLEACVGKAGGSLPERLAGTPIAGQDGGIPIAFWVDAVPAPESERYCGVLITSSGAHWRIVDFER